MEDQETATKENSGNEQGLKRPMIDVEQRIERKLKAVQDPNCIILYPHIKDMHLLAQMLYTFDKTINNMRMGAGINVPLRTLELNMKRVIAFTERLDTFIKALGGTSYYLSGTLSDNAEQRQLMARNKYTHTFIPKTQEAEKIAKLFKSLDSAFCEFKVKVQLADIAKLGEVLAKMKEVVKEFHDLITEFTKQTRTKYVPPKGIDTYLEKNRDKTPGNGKKTPREKKA